MPLKRNASQPRKDRSPVSGSPEVVRARRKEAVRQAGIEAAKAVATGRREKFREALFSASPSLHRTGSTRASMVRQRVP